MKLSTFLSRLEKHGQKGTKAYQMVAELATNEKTIIRPCYTSGSGRWTSNQDHSERVIELLNAMNVKYVEGNDAPRGGATGKFIRITSKIVK